MDDSKKWSLLFATIIATIAIIGFYIYGENSSEMDNPEALYIGFGIGGMFFSIAIMQIMSKSRDSTWDGSVIGKKKILKKRDIGYGNDNSLQEYMEYTVFIRSESGKIYEISGDDDDTLYNYYHIGDKIRHHKGLNSYEKYDKSNDSIIFCNACASLNDMKNDVCFRCNCPLLK